MKGKYHIVIMTKNMKYELDVERKYTIIQGDSATGKTVLYETLLDRYSKIQCAVPVIPMGGILTAGGILSHENRIIVIDENSDLQTKDILDAVEQSSNYYILCTRKPLGKLRYSIDSIYFLKEQKYGGLKKQYTTNVFSSKYTRTKGLKTGDILITEDSKSGKEFFKRIWKEIKTVLPKGETSGNSVITPILKDLVKNHSKEDVVVVIDSAAFGAHIQDLEAIMSTCDFEVFVYAPESFEYLLLYAIGEHLERLTRTYDFCDTKDFDSWELYYTDLLVKYGLEMGFRYSKRSMDNYYYRYLNKVKELLIELS